MTNLLTNSRLKDFRACPRLHRYQYVDGFRPVAQSRAIAFGDLLHRALEAFALGKDRDWTHDDPIELVKAQELFRAYKLHWGEWQNVVAVERGFDCPLPSPDLLSDHPTCRLAGKIDLITEGGVIWDHKTTSESVLPESPLWTRLALDSQISQYFIGAESLGYAPTKWVHDVIRKPEIDLLKATPEEKRKYTQAGKLYANQRAEDETLDEYRQRLRDDIASRPEWYFARRTVVRTEDQLLHHLENLWAWSAMLGNDAQNPEACVRFGSCPFFSCCSTGSEPGDHPDSFRRVTNVHPELESH